MRRVAPNTRAQQFRDGGEEMNDAVPRERQGNSSQDTAQPGAGATSANAWPYGPSFRRRAVLLLLAVYTFNFLDRQILNILAEAIKKDLRLADWQIGVMSGMAFALFYSLLGIPIAQYAERGDRPKLIAAAITVWSLATAACGMTGNFLQLVSTRVIVGIGEAGATPPSHSLISEYTPRTERASALAFYSLGISIGALVGLALGGVMEDYFGWRAAFFFAGLPGLLLALGALWYLREPRRSAHLYTGSQTHHAVSVVGLPALMRSTTFWLLALGATTSSLVGYGVAPFQASFFLRTQGPQLSYLAASFGLMPTGFLGIALGLSSGIAGICGTWFGGRLADRWALTNYRAYALVPALSALIATPCYLGSFLATGLAPALFWRAASAVFYSAWYGPIYAAAHGIVPPNMRATTSAIILFLINLIGLGCGPLIVGILSDVFNHSGGLGPAEGLRMAMIALTFFSPVSAFLFWMASRRLIRDTVS